MQPSPRSPLLVVAAVVGTLALVVTGWLLGHGGGTAPAAAAATGSPDASGDRARDGVLVSGTGEVTGRPDTLVAQFGAEATAGSVDDALARADRAWLERLITRRLPIAEFADALEPHEDDVKVVLRLDA
jgi:hypothetical protein